jgi:hypothetical protein
MRQSADIPSVFHEAYRPDNRTGESTPRPVCDLTAPVDGSLTVEGCSWLAQDVELVLRVVDEVEGAVALGHGQAKQGTATPWADGLLP